MPRHLPKTPIIPGLQVESLLWRHGVRLVAGIDEAGRGALAGPVVAAAVILPPQSEALAPLLAQSSALQQTEIPTVAESEVPKPGRSSSAGGQDTALATPHASGPPVRDSKQLSSSQREVAADLVRQVALGIGIGVVPPSVIDAMGLSFAGQLAFWRAVRALPTDPEHLLIDGFPLWSRRWRQTAVLHGDAICLTIAAASVVAKVTRDRVMRELGQEMPEYGFCHNVGYGTREHRAALRAIGPSVHHRRSYQPVADVLGELPGD